MIIVAHHRSVERYPALAVTSPAAHRCEGTAVAKSSHRELVLNCTVSETIDALRGDRSDLRGDVVSTAHNNVGPQVTNELFVGARSVGYNAKALGFRKLHDVAAVASCRAGDGHGLAWLQSKLVERKPCCERVHRQGGGLGMG